MVYTAEQQFISRAKKALEEGNTSFTARGKNKAIWEKMKQDFEQQRAAATQPSAKRARMASSSSESSSSSSDDAEDVTTPVEEVKKEEDVNPIIEEVNDQEDATPIIEEVNDQEDATPIIEEVNDGGEITPAEPPSADSKAEDKDENLALAHNNNSFMSNWTKEILHYSHPRAAVEWSEYVQTRCTIETLNAIIHVARMLKELEGKGIAECKEELDIRQKYGAGMNWARTFVLRFEDTEHAMTIHECARFFPLLCTVRLNDSSV